MFEKLLQVLGIIGKLEHNPDLAIENPFFKKSRTQVIRKRAGSIKLEKLGETGRFGYEKKVVENVDGIEVVVNETQVLTKDNYKKVRPQLDLTGVMSQYEIEAAEKARLSLDALLLIKPYFLDNPKVRSHEIRNIGKSKDTIEKALCILRKGVKK